MQSSDHPSPGWQSHAVSSAAEINYTAERVLRALEAVVLRPSTAPVVAGAIGVHPRTARRILGTLAAERFVERRGGRGRIAHTYEPTVRLLAVAAQLAPRLPLVQHGRRGVEELHQATGLGAYIAVPSYGQVMVLARAGESAPQLWALLPAPEDAAGQLLLAHRDSWRHSFGGRGSRQADAAEREATATRVRGHVLVASRGHEPASLAVPVPSEEPPIATLAVRGPTEQLVAEGEKLITLAQRIATRVANESADPSRPAGRLQTCEAA